MDSKPTCSITGARATEKSLASRMRNLEVTRCVVLPSNPLLSRCSWFCLDCDNGSVWVATKDGLCCVAEKEVRRTVREEKEDCYVASPLTPTISSQVGDCFQL